MKKINMVCVFGIVGVFALILSGYSQPGGAEPGPETFTVTWKNYDGATLETDTGVAKGAMPVYNGATPHQPNDATYIYTFSVWNPAPAAVISDAVYTAQLYGICPKIDLGEWIKEWMN
jgi:hypothetical protein